MKIEFRLFNGPSDWGWVKSHVPLLRVQDTCGIMAIDTEKNETVGAAIFDNFLHNSAQGTFIVTTPMVLKHGFLEEIADFIFEHCGKDYIYALVQDGNKKAIKLNHHLGFRQIFRMPEGFGKGVDFLVLSLHKDDCRFFSGSKAAQQVA